MQWDEWWSRDRDVAPTDEPSEELNRLSHAVIGAAMAVHTELGPGHLESSYERALHLELTARGIPFVKRPRVVIAYRGEPVGESELDLIVDGKLIVELKAVEALGPIHKAQVIAYLKATGLELGLLINFNVTHLKHGIRRIANSRQ
ncbi:MAG TPA: GxxExxY protein [Humisphaera sp.]